MIKQLYYKYLHNFAYLIWYSIKDIYVSILEFLIEFKNPRTWSMIALIFIFISIYTRNYILFKFMFPFSIIMYVIRQKYDGRYKEGLKKHALLSNNDLLLKDYYNKYSKKCFFSNQEPLKYEQWKDKMKEGYREKIL